MIPIMLDPALVRVAVCGEGILTLRRLKWLRECGTKPIVFAPLPSPELKELAGEALLARLPERSDFEGLAAIWIADLDLDIAAPLAQLGRDVGVLVNVEDVLDYCDFHTPAIVHRGRLTFAIGTGGASPAIASIIRQRLETAFPPEWSQLVEEIAESRLALKAKGATFPELVADAKARLADSGL
jgi:precorrin-2 dehydrogenase / sirohydrochlorin ferrochelatase